MSKDNYTSNEEYWDAQEFCHSYHLQQMSPTQFVSAVDRILSNETRLIGPRRAKCSDAFAVFLDR